jgi:hypothetical protein
VLEYLQERDRQGVEGDVPYRGRAASMRQDTARQMMDEALRAIPDDEVPRDVTSISPEWLRQVAAATDSVSLDDAQRIADETRRQSAMAQSPSQWSRFEHPVASSILMDIASRIEDTIAALGRPRHQQSIPTQIMADDLPWTLPDEHRPAIGTFSTGQFDTRAQSAGDGIVLLVQNGLFPLAHVLAQVGVFGRQEAMASGRLSAPTVQSISDVTASYVTLGHPLGLPVRQGPPQLRAAAAAAEDAILVFVLAHEYAHILNGDLTAHPLVAPAGQRSYAEKEYLADLAGLRITLMAAIRDRQLAAAAMWGPFLFLAGLDVLVRAEAAIGRVAPVLENHPDGPTPFERLDNLQKAVAQSELIGVYRDALRGGIAGFNAILFAWDIVMPAMWEMSEELTALVSAGEPLGYEADMIQHAAITGLWAKVEPRLATQREIPRRWR